MKTSFYCFTSSVRRPSGAAWLADVKERKVITSFAVFRLNYLSRVFKTKQPFTAGITKHSFKETKINNKLS